MLATEVKNFKTIIKDIAQKIEETQFAIFQSVNASVMDLYFYIGKMIDDKIQWGNKFIKRYIKIF